MLWHINCSGLILDLGINSFINKQLFSFYWTLSQQFHFYTVFWYEFFVYLRSWQNKYGDINVKKKVMQSKLNTFIKIVT